MIGQGVPNKPGLTRYFTSKYPDSPEATFQVN